MKSNSLVDFRRKNRRTKLLVLFSILVIGAIFRLEKQFHTLRLQDVSQSPKKVLTEAQLWGCFSSFEKNCSPMIFVTRYKLCKKLEMHYPSEVRLVSTGWGKWCLCFASIKPMFRVSYRGKEYYLNSRNKLWSISLKENKNVDGEIAFSIPKLIIADDIEFILSNADKTEKVSEKAEIFDTSIDVSKIKLWYNELNELGWLKYVSACGVHRDRQQFLVKVYLTSLDPGVQRSVLILNENVATWNAKNLAIKKIWGGIDKIPHGLSIDVHFEDKILAKPIH